MSGVRATDKVEVFEKGGIVELFLKRKGSARETGDKDDGGLGRIACSMGPDLSAVLGLDKVSERGHEERVFSYGEKGRRDE